MKLRLAVLAAALTTLAAVAGAQCVCHPSPVGCTRTYMGVTYVIVPHSYYPPTWSDSCGNVWTRPAETVRPERPRPSKAPATVRPAAPRRAPAEESIEK